MGINAIDVHLETFFESQKKSMARNLEAFGFLNVKSKEVMGMGKKGQPSRGPSKHGGMGGKRCRPGGGLSHQRPSGKRR